MFRNIDKAIAYIESKRHKNTIESFGRILEELGINTKQKNMIHIAGTNGKGSTSELSKKYFKCARISCRNIYFSLYD